MVAVDSTPKATVLSLAVAMAVVAFVSVLVLHPRPTATFPLLAALALIAMLIGLAKTTTA